MEIYRTQEAVKASAWPRDERSYEPKWNGYRAQAHAGNRAQIWSRLGNPLLPSFAELEAPLRTLPAGTVLDCELVVADAAGLMVVENVSHRRGNPRLASRLPAHLVAFDLLAHEGNDCRALPYRTRRAMLERIKLPEGILLTPATTRLDEARAWYETAHELGCDGLMAKCLSAPYESGRRTRSWLKLKYS